MKNAVLFCACGKVCQGQGWTLPTATFLSFLKHLIAREVSTITFVKTTCPDCFERRRLGVYAGKEAV
jgi:hypothetical protein